MRATQGSRSGLPLRQKRSRHVIEKDAFLTAPQLTLDERLAIILRSGGSVVCRVHTWRAGPQDCCQAVGSKPSLSGSHMFEPAQGAEHPAHVGGKEEVVDIFFKAIAERRRVRVEYGKPHAAVEMFEIDLCKLYVLGDAFYLDVFHWGRKALRCFKVCRIREAWLMDIVFSNTRGYAYAPRRENSFCVFATDNDQ